MRQFDWLSHLLQMITVTGRLEVHCTYAAPWRVDWPQAATHEIPYHIVLQGKAFLEDSETGSVRELGAGDIVLLPHGSPHVLHDGSGELPAPLRHRKESTGWMRSENDGQGERLDMLCGRFFIAPPYFRLIRDYLPSTLVVRSSEPSEDEEPKPASTQLACLVGLMRREFTGNKPGGYAILNALTSALFTLILRASSESGQAPAGLLALAGHPRLAPAISAMFADPARAWNLPELADLCNMSRATFMRQFQDKVGRSAIELLTDIRMSLASTELKKPGMSTEAVADTVGYRSVAAFRRVFTDKMGVTPGQWRRLAHESVT